MAFVPRLLRPLLVYPARGGLRFGGARIGCISLPIRGGALPIRIVTFLIRVESFPIHVESFLIHVGARSFVSHPCGPQNEKARFFIDCGGFSAQCPQLLFQRREGGGASFEDGDKTRVQTAKTLHSFGTSDRKIYFCV